MIKKERLARKLDCYMNIQGKAAVFVILCKTFSEQHLEYLLALEEQSFFEL